MKSKCNYCNKDFRWFGSQKSGKYCSQSCQINGDLIIKIKSGKYTKENARTYFKRLVEKKCVECGIKTWRGHELNLQIDHIDGDRSNNKIKNLRYLCPNCHSLTPTFGTRNMSESGRQRCKQAGSLGNKIKNGRLPKGSKLGVLV